MEEVNENTMRRGKQHSVYRRLSSHCLTPFLNKRNVRLIVFERCNEAAGEGVNLGS